MTASPHKEYFNKLKMKALGSKKKRRTAEFAERQKKRLSQHRVDISDFSLEDFENLLFKGEQHK
jgi:hypothetical protein